MPEEFVFSDSFLAAHRLERGLGVDWQPGDGGRYELYRLHASAVSRAMDGTLNVTTMLVVANLGMAIPLRSSWIVDWWVRDHLGGLNHPGVWAALRPVMAALGHASGPVGYDPRDADREREERARQHQAMPYAQGDSELGRAVRLMVERDNRRRQEAKPVRRGRPGASPRLILKVLQEANEPLSAQQILEGLKTLGWTTKSPTALNGVYTNVSRLVDRGLVRRLYGETKGSLRYELAGQVFDGDV